MLFFLESSNIVNLLFVGLFNSKIFYEDIRSQKYSQ